jgi:glucosyl-dolichyl phosphate glucuronosyltransferase
LQNAGCRADNAVNGMKKPSISVVICVYNGASRMKACLQSLAEQTASADRFEVIIIDNNSSDDSYAVATAFLRHVVNAKLFQETRIGLSHARNRGLKESMGDYVAYLDDDAKTTPAWIELALKIIDEQAPDMFGGPIYPVYETPPPPWLKDEYNSYSVYDGPRYLECGQLLSGSNIFLRRDMLCAYEGFDPELGMAGDCAGYHEETAFQLRAQTDGRRTYYDPRLYVLHLVSRAKQNILYYLYSHYKSGKDGARVWPAKYNTDDLLSLVKNIDSFFLSMNTAVRFRDENVHPHPENYVIEKLLPGLFLIGRAFSYWSGYRSGREFILELLRGEDIPLIECLRIYQMINRKKVDLPDLLAAYQALTPDAETILS